MLQPCEIGNNRMHLAIVLVLASWNYLAGTIDLNLDSEPIGVNVLAKSMSLVVGHANE